MKKTPEQTRRSEQFLKRRVVKENRDRTAYYLDAIATERIVAVNGMGPDTQTRNDTPLNVRHQGGDETRH